MNIKIYDSRDFPSYLPKLNQLYDELLMGGKGFRAKLVTQLSERLDLPVKTHHLLAQTIEFIHNASLLHDDLIDQSVLRRGKPAAWHKYGSDYAVLAGDYLLARVMVNLSSHGNLQLVHYTALMISDLLEGEWLQDSLVGDFTVGIDELDRVHNLKTSSLFKWCLRSPFIAKGLENSDLHDLLDKMGALLGQLFQRSDDLLDFNIRNWEEKALLGDLKSGYLNSFASYCVTQRVEPLLEKHLRDCLNLDDFISLMGGAERFQDLVKHFDIINQQKIDLYHHYADQLVNHLQPSQNDMVIFLKSLTTILYWRQKP